jgi:hypothetical protein
MPECLFAWNDFSPYDPEKTRSARYKAAFCLQGKGTLGWHWKKILRKPFPAVKRQPNLLPFHGPKRDKPHEGLPSVCEAILPMGVALFAVWLVRYGHRLTTSGKTDISSRLSGTGRDGQGQGDQIHTDFNQMILQCFESALLHGISPVEFLPGIGEVPILFLALIFLTAGGDFAMLSAKI